MTRSVTSAMGTALAGQTHTPILLIRAQFDSGDLNLWTGVGQLTWNSLTFEGTGDLLRLEPIEETIDTRATGIAAVLSGVDAAIISLAENEDYQERPMTVWLAELDSTGAIIADPVKLFKGRMDVMTTEDQGSEARIVLSAEARSVDQSRPNRRDYTDADQKLDYSADEGFSMMAAMQDASIHWGPGAPQK